jgi:16S rRNA (guanine966-N2)-methyltransferase
MMSKVKEALYSTLGGFGCFDERFMGVTGIRHLDLYSGSGSVGIESLSRGASHATFVDFAKNCCEVAEKNVAWCGFDWDGAGANKQTILCPHEKVLTYGG